MACGKKNYEAYRKSAQSVSSHSIEYFEGIEPPAKLEVYEDNTRSILPENKSPDLGFRWSVNPYRGCQHACAYCYARPSHEYLGWGAGTDFETKILVKKNAPELLREAFLKRSWKGELIIFSGDTDCYQPLEASYKLTRRCFEVCLEAGNPVSIITKSFLIARDIDLLTALHQRTDLTVNFSIGFWDEAAARLVEPGAASIHKRFEAMALLAEKGIHVNVLVAPIIPGLSDSDIPRILKKAVACGARYASPVILRLPGPVKSVFLERMQKAFPMRYNKIENSIRRSRGGELYKSEFGQRFRGEGKEWENIRNMFEMYCRKFGLNRDFQEPDRPDFIRPGNKFQKEFAFTP